MKTVVVSFHMLCALFMNAAACVYIRAVVENFWLKKLTAAPVPTRSRYRKLSDL